VADIRLPVDQSPLTDSEQEGNVPYGEKLDADLRVFEPSPNDPPMGNGPCHSYS
jgi:hypothetical protein